MQIAYLRDGPREDGEGVGKWVRERNKAGKGAGVTTVGSRGLAPLGIFKQVHGIHLRVSAEGQEAGGFIHEFQPLIAEDRC